MLVVPLIFVSLVRAFTRVEGEKNLGKIGFNVLAVLIITVAVASVIGLSIALLFNLDGAEFTQGAAETARIAYIQERQAEIADTTLPQQILSFIPTNIFEDLAGLRQSSNIAVVIFSAFVGVAYLGVARKHPEEASYFKMIDMLDAIVSRIVTLILRMAPYGIFALMVKNHGIIKLQAL